MTKPPIMEAPPPFGRGRPRRRWGRRGALTFALAASLLAHGAGVATLALSRDLRLPIDIIPLRSPPQPVQIAEAPPTPAPPSPAPPPVPSKPHVAQAPKPTKPKPTKPKPPPPSPPSASVSALQAAASLRQLAPGDARVAVLLRTDRLRRSPHRAAVEGLLGALPDYHLLDGTGLSPVDDLDALFIATANPFDVSATFLAARHAADGRVSAALASRHLSAHDPRRFSQPTPTLTVLSRPDVTPPKTAHAPNQWTEALARFDEVADGASHPALLVEIQPFDAFFRLGDGLPTPRALTLAATADAAPRVRLRAVFPDAGAAGRLIEAWPAIRGRWRASTGLFGLGGLLDELTLARDGAAVELDGVLPEAQFRAALGYARMMLAPTAQR